MLRPKLTAASTALLAALLVGPTLSSVVLAADPTVVVKAGDTVTGIAKRNGVSIATIVELNALTDPNRIYVGQRLRIGTDPAAGAPPPSPSQAAAPAQTDAAVHFVARGENLTRIARRYGVTVAAIVGANGIGDPSRIFAGQQLTIPGSVPPAPAAAPAAPAAPPAPAPAPPSSPAAQPTVHVVARGENLTRIARHYGVSVAAIVDANAIRDPGRIFGGQRLTIPGAGTAAPATPAPPAVAPAPPMPASMAALVAQRGDVRQVIVEEAARHGVPAAFALAVAWQESGWQQRVVSHAGAVGVMQLMPATAEWVGQVMLRTNVDINDTRQNVAAGVRLLAHYLQRYNGDRDLVLAAYYQGQWATDRHGIYAVSRPYIASIRLLERMFGG